MYSKTMTVEDLCRKLRPIFGKKIDDLYLKYSLISDRQQKVEIEQALQALYQKHLTESLLNEEVLLEPPKKNIIGGDYPLGKVVYGKKELHPFGLREKDWIRHMCVTGMSGSGKTTFAFQILGNFIFHKKPFLVFDWKKSFRPLMLLNEKLHVFTVGDDSIANFKLNINKPPAGVNPKEWINLLADLITESFSASFGVHKLLVQTLDKAFSDFGVYAGSKNYPTWYQIRDRLEDKAQSLTRKTRESEWLESALRIAYSLTFGNFGSAICYKGADANNVEDLLKKEVIMELASLSNTEKKFFCQFILAYIYKYAKAGNVNTTEEFKSAILVDEAHNIFLKDRPNFIMESIPDIIFREIREYGISLITLDQHISKLSDVVAGNSACNIAFQQMLPDDIDKVSRLMHLQEYKSYFAKLPVGVGIVRLVERHHDPFVVKAPLVKLKSKSISNEELKKRMKVLSKSNNQKKFFEERCKDDMLAKEVKKLENIYKLTAVKPDYDSLVEQISNKDYKELVATMKSAQKDYEQMEKDKEKNAGLTNYLQQKIFDITKKRLLRGEKIKDIKAWFIRDGYNRADVNHTFNYIKKSNVLRKIKTDTELKEKVALTQDQKKLLKTSLENPEAPITNLYKLAGFSPRKGNALKKELEENGVIVIEEIRSPKGWTKRVKINFNEKLNEELSHSQNNH